MELDLGPEIAEFRAELRDWIAAEAPAPLAGLADWNMPLTAGPSWPRRRPIPPTPSGKPSWPTSG
jgi:hypothetical protein